MACQAGVTEPATSTPEVHPELTTTCIIYRGTDPKPYEVTPQPRGEPPRPGWRSRCAAKGGGEMTPQPAHHSGPEAPGPAGGPGRGHSAPAPPPGVHHDPIPGPACENRPTWHKALTRCALVPPLGSDGREPEEVMEALVDAGMTSPEITGWPDEETQHKVFECETPVERMICNGRKNPEQGRGYHGVQNMKFAPKKSGTYDTTPWTWYPGSTLRAAGAR